MPQVRLSEKAYHLIKDQIVTLQLPPLSIIDEQALRAELKLGRTPIREALHRLAAEGLVIIAPRRGMFVADISLTDLAKIFELRMALEGFCARVASERITPEQISRMKSTLSDLGDATKNNAKTLMEMDVHFHELLYEAADNKFLDDTLKRLHALSLRLWYLVLDRIENVAEAIEQHRNIVAALEDHDGDLAEVLIREHIADFQREIKAAL